MIDPADTTPNPFVTRHVRPGAIQYRFVDGQSAAGLVERLRDNDWRGQLLGGHGTGKSTLIQTLLPHLERAGRRVELFRIEPGQGRLKPPSSHWSSRTQLIVDGWEQLGRWNRWQLERACRRRRAGLLVTAHASAGLPTIYQTTVSPQLAQQLVDELLAAHAHAHPAARPQPPISPDDVGHAYERQGGNLRETLFVLYDLYEQRRPRSTTPPPSAE